MLNIIGGTYLERCREPHYYEMFGSGLRGAIALSEKLPGIKFHSCCSDENKETILSICNTFDISAVLDRIENTISWIYDHPLAKPVAIPDPGTNQIYLHPVNEENILYYGMIEASAKVSGNYVVYDPQNWKTFKSTGSSAKHLAIILNKKEALLFYNQSDDEDLDKVGRFILQNEGAEVVVIKNGSNGALVVDKTESFTIPVYKTDNVWPIGSGDIFSAVFAWKWIEDKLSPNEAANLASMYTAIYCETQQLPISDPVMPLEALKPSHTKKKIYLAGPFFSTGERWLIKELRKTLLDFGNDVFSPLHDVGLGISKEMVEKDIEGIRQAEVLLGVVSGLDPGTLFEIGYAKALGKKVIVLAEGISTDDLVMLIGTDCEITYNLSTAVYKASW